MGLPGMPGLPELTRWWQQVTKIPGKWGDVKGPISATRRIAKQIGWQIQDESPLIMTTRQGLRANVLEHGPKHMKELLKKDWMDIIAEQLAQQQGMGAGQKLDFQHAQRYLAKHQSEVTEQAKATVRNFLVGGSGTPHDC